MSSTARRPPAVPATAGSGADDLVTLLALLAFSAAADEPVALADAATALGW